MSYNSISVKQEAPTWLVFEGCKQKDYHQMVLARDSKQHFSSKDIMILADEHNKTKPETKGHEFKCYCEGELGCLKWHVK